MVHDTLHRPESRDLPVVHLPRAEGTPMTRRHCWLVGLVGLISVQLALPAHGQSLVEAARLAQLARSGAAGTTPTYTQADLPPREARPTPRQPTEPVDEVDEYRALLEASLERQRDLERRLSQERATAPPIAPARRRTDHETAPDHEDGWGPDSSGPGIPLALAYGSSPGPLYYLGQPVRRSRPGGERRSGPRGTRGRGRASISPPALSGHNEGSPAASPPPVRRAPARNGYAESSRPMQYVAPGLPVPRVQSQSRPGGR